MKGGLGGATKQKGYGNGSGGDSYRTGNHTGDYIQNPDTSVRQCDLRRSECIGDEEPISFFSKRGSEIVEAAIVLPIFILIVASVISVSLFFVNAFHRQCRVQEEVIAAVNEDRSIVKKIEINDELSSRIKGLYDRIFAKSYKASRYSLDEEAMVRAGELIL